MEDKKQTQPADNQETEPSHPAGNGLTAEAGIPASEDIDSQSSADDLNMPDMDFAKTAGKAKVETTPGEAKAAESEADSSVGDLENPDELKEKEAEAAMLKMMEEETGAPPKTQTDDKYGPDGEPEPVVQKAAFQPLRDESKGEAKNLDMLLDVTLPISIELGRTAMAIEDILNLGPGSVVELDKLAGEPVDLLVNNKLLAKGEVVVIDENFGVRITSMISPQDRIRSLQ